VKVLKSGGGEALTKTGADMQLQSMTLNQLRALSNFEKLERHRDTWDYFLDISFAVADYIDERVESHSRAVEEHGREYRWPEGKILDEKILGMVRITDGLLREQEQIWAHRERGEVLPGYLVKLDRMLKSA
jgi:hypothetical protein